MPSQISTAQWQHLLYSKLKFFLQQRITMSLDEDLQDLASAEDFLEYFQINYDTDRVKVYRLHILQRFHDYLAQQKANQLNDEAEKQAVYTQLLQQAYQDFVTSDAQTEKVFKVFRRDEPQVVKITVDSIRKQ